MAQDGDGSAAGGISLEAVPEPSVAQPLAGCSGFCWSEPLLLPAALPGCRGRHGAAEATRGRCDDGLAVVVGEGASGACCQTGGTSWVGFPRPAVTLVFLGVLRVMEKRVDLVNFAL